MWNQPYRKNDLEGGAVPLYPMMLESPELRWAFIRKIYSILTVQLILTIAVASIVVALRPVQEFFATTTAGFALYIVLIITPFIGKNFLSLWVQIHRLIGLIIWLVDGGFFFFTKNAVLCPLYYYYQKHPVNYFLLGVFTVALAFAVGLTCAFTKGKNFFQFSPN